MDLQSVIVGSILVAIFIVPLFFLQKRQSKKQLEDLLNIAAKHQMVVDMHDLWDPCFALGLDSKSRKLVYARKLDTRYKEVVIDLAEVGSCSLYKTSRDVNGDKVIDLIGLQFTYRKDFKTPDTYLEFYNKEERLNLNDELQLAEKWHKLILAYLAVPAKAV